MNDTSYFFLYIYCNIYIVKCLWNKSVPVITYIISYKQLFTYQPLFFSLLKLKKSKKQMYITEKAQKM